MTRRIFVAGVAAVCTAALLAGCGAPGASRPQASDVARVLLVSVDGLHQADLASRVRDNPN